MATMYRGWINGQEKDASVLTAIGIKLGPWDTKSEAWTLCEVPADAMEKLNGWRGQFIWGLEPAEV